MIELKQGSLGTKMGRGEVRIGVPVQGCTEHNNAKTRYFGNTKNEVLKHLSN